MSATYIDVNGHMRHIRPIAGEGHPYSICELSKCLGVFLANVAPLSNDFYLLFFRDGPDVGFPYNETVSKLASCPNFPGLIYGDAIIVPSDELYMETLDERVPKGWTPRSHRPDE